MSQTNGQFDAPTVRVALLKTDPLSQRAAGPDDGFVDDMRARTLEVLHSLRAMATGRYAVYLWTGVVLLGAGLAFRAGWARTAPPVLTTPKSMTCVEGEVMVSRGSTWRPVTSIPPGTSAICSGPTRTVVLVGHGTTVRLQGQATFNWRLPSQGRMLFSVSCGRAWFDLKDDTVVSFPGGQSSAEAGTVAELSIQASETDLVCRTGTLRVQDRMLRPGDALRIGSDGRMADGGGLDSDVEWERWNRDWASLHPTVGVPR